MSFTVCVCVCVCVWSVPNYSAFFAGVISIKFCICILYCEEVLVYTSLFSITMLSDVSHFIVFIN